MPSEDLHFKPTDPPQFPSSANISFNNVVMKYQPHLPPVLNNISFDIKHGHKVGIIGRTGSGKSSVTQALFRLVE